jgi:hypothetical protein
MAFNFPDAPVAGDTHTEFGVEYVWDGAVWNLAGGGAMGDYVQKAGDTMTGGLRVKPAGVGGVRMSPGDAGRAGMFEFYDAADVRMGYIGWGNNEFIRFFTEPGKKWDVQGRGFLMNEGAGIHWGTTPAQSDKFNFSEGICLYGYGGTSQFGFTITSGTLNYIVQSDANKHDFWVGAINALSLQKTTSYINTHLTLGASKNLVVGGTINATGEIRGKGNIFAERDLHATGNFDIDGTSDFAGTVELRGPVNTRASFNAYGGVRLMDNQQLHFDGGKNEGEGQSVAMLFRKKGGSELWGEIAYQAVDYGGGGTDEANLRFQLAQGGYGWSNALEVKTGQIYCPRDCSAASFIDRGVAATKSDICDPSEGDVLAAFDALRPRRFRKLDAAPVDYDGNPLPLLPTPKLRFGFVADELHAKPEVRDVVGTDLHGEIIGTDIMQVLALTVAKVKLLEARLAALEV